MFFLLKQEVGSRIISKGLYLYFEQAILLFKILKTIFFVKKNSLVLTKAAFIIYKLDKIDFSLLECFKMEFISVRAKLNF